MSHKSYYSDQIWEVSFPPQLPPQLYLTTVLNQIQQPNVCQMKVAEVKSYKMGVSDFMCMNLVVFYMKKAENLQARSVKTREKRQKFEI